jgi:hypothetical protein
MNAGRAIRAGDYRHGHLATIYEWKTKGRGRNRLLRNSRREVAEALRLATTAKTERAAVAVLLGLHGVNVPVASAILTVVHPRRYTIIDFRALEALGSKTRDRSLGFYLKYLAACRTIARSWGVSLRDLDRALWQWSKVNQRR